VQTRTGDLVKTAEWWRLHPLTEQFMAGCEQRVGEQRGMDGQGLARTGTDWHGLARTGTDWHGRKEMSNE
jgi:hypothetical protein